MPSNTESFYSALPVFDDFLDITEPASFTPVPDDWHVVVSDVQGSTDAIRKGGYKDVNVAGAASIISILNINRSLPVPFIFGGDGSTLCIPPSWIMPAHARLLGAVQMTRQALGLSLRAGLIPVRTIRMHGYDVRVARNRVSAGFVQAVFTGGGVQFAEEIIKTPAGAQFLLAADGVEPLFDFSGLECRWNDIPSIHGEVVSLIVKAAGTSPEEAGQTYRNLIVRIRDIYGTDRESHPVNPLSLRMSLFGRNPRREQRVRSCGKRMIERLKYAVSMRSKILAGRVLIRLRLSTKETRWGLYPEELAANTDCRKFSDIFRQVLSGTSQQREELSSYLESHYRDGKLVYGMHASRTALLTCLIFSYSQSHMHLVDGGDGGYALAAAEFKERMKNGGGKI